MRPNRIACAFFAAMFFLTNHVHAASAQASPFDITCRANTSVDASLIGVTSGVLVVEDGSGNEIYGFDEQNCGGLWSSRLDPLAVINTDLVGGVVVVQTLDTSNMSTGSDFDDFYSSPGYLIGLDAKTGRELWRSSTTTGYASWLTSIDDTIVVDGQAKLEAFDLRTGLLIWAAEPSPTTSFWFRSAVSHGLYVRWETTDEATSDEAKIVARDLHSGRVTWSIGATLALGSDLTYIPAADGFLLPSAEGTGPSMKMSLRLVGPDGRVHWEAHVAGGFHPVSDQRAVYFVEDENHESRIGSALIAQSIDDGSELWRSPALSESFTISVGSDQVTTWRYGDNLLPPTITSYDTRSGRLMWSYTLPSDPRSLTPTATFASEIVSVRSDSSITILDLRTGREIWQRSFPEFDSDDMVVLANNGWCLELEKNPVILEADYLFIASCRGVIARIDFR